MESEDRETTERRAQLLNDKESEEENEFFNNFWTSYIGLSKKTRNSYILACSGIYLFRKDQFT